MICYQNPFIWEENFPAVYGHTSVSFLKRCPGYEAAKNGSMQAAVSVVSTCVKPGRITEFAYRYKGSVLLPIITKNKLPEALAARIGLRVHKGVYIGVSPGRKSYSAMERLLHKPVFRGEIVRGERYVIVDDVVTQGGTISSLRKHVISGGGSVEAVMALSYSPGSLTLAPDRQDYYNITNKFGATKITDILINYRIAEDIRELTKSEIRYLLRFKEIKGIFNKISYTVGSQ